MDEVYYEKEYEQFCKLFEDMLKLVLNVAELQLYRNKVTKVNEKKDGLTIKFPDSDIAPTVYLDDVYKLHREGCTIAELANRTAESLRNTRAETPKVPELSKETARKNLYCAVVNAAANEELLKDIPHERINDLAVIARFRIGDSGNFIVKNEMCRYLHMTSEEILETAHKNTERQEFTCRSMSETMREIMLEEGMTEEYADELIEIQGKGCPMYVVTNASRIDGAAAILSPSAMDTAVEKIKKDYPDTEKIYVLGSSRHELLLLPDHTVSSVDDLLEIHHQVQDTELADTDKLSEHIYLYDNISKRLTIADAPALTEDAGIIKNMEKTHARTH